MDLLPPGGNFELLQRLQLPYTKAESIVNDWRWSAFNSVRTGLSVGLIVQKLCRYRTLELFSRIKIESRG